MKYTVIITEDKHGNVFAMAPGLPDCHVQAKTRKEVIRKIREVITEIISRSEVIQLEVSAEPKSGVLHHETPWEFFGAYQNEPAWGAFFDEVERRRDTVES